MAGKTYRNRPGRLVTLDPATVKAALVVSKRQKPPITALSRLIDAALAEWTERHGGRKERPDA